MRTVRGIAASPGVAVGQALVWQRPALQVGWRRCTADQVDHEFQRLTTALDVTRQQLTSLREQMQAKLGSDSAAILDAQILILEDEELLRAAQEGIRTHLLKAEAAFARAMGEALLPLEVHADRVFRERIIDFRDVEHRVLRALLGKGEDRPVLTQPSIIVASDLTPSDTAAFDRRFIVAFCIDEGGPTSHTAIISRSLGVPAIVGLRDFSTSVASGDELAVDGSAGVVYQDPDEDTRKRFRQRQEHRAQVGRRLLEAKDDPAETPDGHRIELSANVELPVEIDLAIERGADSIGLLRTEFFYFRQATLPNEEEQVEAYVDVLRRANGATVIFRALDAGGDKFLEATGGYREYNPFLGWRGIRFLLSNRELLHTHVRALYRASASGPMKLMFPMITGLHELRAVQTLAATVREELRAEGKPFQEGLQLGIMVETPSAVAMARELAAECDFFSIGSNDLTQYILAVDRTNPRVAHMHQAHHPAVLRAIDQTIQAAHDAGIWVGLCGEMAGHAPHAMVLVGLGIDEISTHAAAIPVVKKAIRTTPYSQIQEWAQHVLTLSTAEDVTAFLRARTQEGLRGVLGGGEG